MSISTPAGGDRQGRRPKRLLTPSQKYEIWLQLVRQEVTVAEAAANHRVDRTTIMRIRTIAKVLTVAVDADDVVTGFADGFGGVGQDGDGVVVTVTW